MGGSQKIFQLNGCFTKKAEFLRNNCKNFTFVPCIFRKLAIKERVLFKTLECFPSALFPKIWNSIELELKETKSAKSFKKSPRSIQIVMQVISVKKLCIMWINLALIIFFILQFINMILITYITLCSNPFGENPPFFFYSLTSPYLFPGFSSLLCLKCTMYSVQCTPMYFSIYNSHLFMVGQSIKTTNSGQAVPNYKVNMIFICIISCYVVE